MSVFWSLATHFRHFLYEYQNETFTEKNSICRGLPFQVPFLGDLLRAYPGHL